jgi:hypothetical protein
MGAFGPRLPAAQLRSDRKIGTWLLIGYIAAFLAAALLAQLAGGKVVALTLVAVIPMTLPIGLIWAMSSDRCHPRPRRPRAQPQERIDV